MVAQKYLVIVPTYNERENIARLVSQVLDQGPAYEVLIVDDNSPDGTGEIAEELARCSQGRVWVLHRAGKLGLGSAYLEGFRYGLSKGYDYLFQMDADFSHQPRYLNQLLAAAQRTGIAIGSRLVAGGGVEHWPWYRKFISQGGSLYARTLLGLKTRDCTGGFKCFARSTLLALNLGEQVQAKGFGFQVEVNSLCEWYGYDITEVPIIFPDRTAGKSKMNKAIFLEALALVWKLRQAKDRRQRAALSRLCHRLELTEAGQYRLNLPVFSADGEPLNPREVER